MKPAIGGVPIIAKAATVKQIIVIGSLEPIPCILLIFRVFPCFKTTPEHINNVPFIKAWFAI